MLLLFNHNYNPAWGHGPNQHNTSWTGKNISERATGRNYVSAANDRKTWRVFSGLNCSVVLNEALPPLCVFEESEHCANFALSTSVVEVWDLRKRIYYLYTTHWPRSHFTLVLIGNYFTSSVQNLRCNLGHFISKTQGCSPTAQGPQGPPVHSISI